MKKIKKYMNNYSVKIWHSARTCVILTMRQNQTLVERADYRNIVGTISPSPRCAYIVIQWRKLAANWV